MMVFPLARLSNWHSISLLLGCTVLSIIGGFFYNSWWQHVLLLALVSTAFGLLIVRLLQQENTLMTAINAAQSSARFSALQVAAIDSAPFGVAITNPGQPENPIIFVNQAFSVMTGYTASEAIGRSFNLLFGIHTSKEDIGAIADAFANKAGLRLTTQHYHKSQTPFWNNLQISPLFDDDGELKNFILIIDEVTAMHNTQQALRVAKEQAERATNVKSNFMAMMSHEIRTPINGVLGTLSLLCEMPLGDEAKQLAETSYNSADALLTIVNDMLDFSKIEAGRLNLEAVQFDLPDLITGCMALLQPNAERKRIGLNLIMDDKLPNFVSSDPTRIKQVLLNLISNAVKFTDKGAVTVKISNLLAQTSEAGTDCIVRFEVADTGIGMSQDGMTKIFTEFHQIDPSIARRYGGTGLGLAICKRLVQMMHGEIDVESRLGEGSKFSFVLPLPVVNATHAKHVESAKPVSASQSRDILVVEDNATNQLVLTKMLERAGHRFAIAENGAIAVGMIQAQAYDLVFMDVSMPVMDGLTATRQIRSLGGRYATVPIIAMTAQSMQGDRERCLASGMNDYLGKPVRRDALLKMLQHWLKQDESTCDATLAEGNGVCGGGEVIDWQVLEQMVEDVGPETIERLLSVFEQDMVQRLGSFKNAIRNENWELMKREAHTLKSSSASCGLASLSATMEEIESALEHGNRLQAVDRAAHVDGLALAAQSALRDVRNRYQRENLT